VCVCVCVCICLSDCLLKGKGNPALVAYIHAYTHTKLHIFQLSRREIQRNILLLDTNLALY
jgi:hypothetical protein